MVSFIFVLYELQAVPIKQRKCSVAVISGANPGRSQEGHAPLSLLKLVIKRLLSPVAPCISCFWVL